MDISAIALLDTHTGHENYYHLTASVIRRTPLFYRHIASSSLPAKIDKSDALAPPSHTGCRERQYFAGRPRLLTGM